MSSSATHARHARPRLARRLPAVVAAPVLCGAAAAFVVAGTPASSLAATKAPAHEHTSATAVTAESVVTASAHVVSATQSAAKHAQRGATPATYTVKSGDTLSAIAGHFYQDPKFWPAIYWANHHHIRYANAIQVGQVLSVPAKPARAPAAPSQLSAPAPAPVHTSSYESTAPVHHYTHERSTSQASAPVSTSGYGSFQQCVISRESGGNSQVMNSSGHYGLYQFSSSTWAAYGGSPSDFGHASVSEQNQVFDNAMAAGGRSNWAPYDGC